MIFKNGVILAGELVEKGELCYAKEEKYLNFVLKVCDVKDAEILKERVFTIACKGSTAFAVSKNAQIGDKLFVEGRLKEVKLRKKDGSSLFAASVIADKIMF